MSGRQFAKVFEKEGEQVLVYRDKADDGDQEIVFMFDNDGLTFRVRLGFDESKSASDVDQKLAEVDETTAFSMRAHTLDKLGVLAK